MPYNIAEEKKYTRIQNRYWQTRVEFQSSLQSLYFGRFREKKLFFSSLYVVFIGHCLNYYGLAVATSTHRYSLCWADCVRVEVVHAFAHTLVYLTAVSEQFRTNPIVKFIDGNMQPNDIDRKQKMLGTIANGFHIDRSFTVFFTS